MPQVDQQSEQSESTKVKVVSQTIPRLVVDRILKTKGILFPEGHFEYPVTYEGKVGNHLDTLFVIEPLTQSDAFVDTLVSDICLWLDKEQISFDTIFAPAQAAVQKIVRSLAKKTGASSAFLEYLPQGWFGESLVEGKISPNQNVLVFNGVTQQGRCVGMRLPEFVEKHGGKVVAAAVFAKGTAAGVKDAECRYGSKFYATISVDINVYAPKDCPICSQANSQPLIPWTQMRGAQLRDQKS
jgi:orotate phosphoribosyltransferase